MDRLNEARKALASVLTGLLAWGTAVVASDSAPITASEWITLAGVGVASALVYLIPNAQHVETGEADAVQGPKSGKGYKVVTKTTGKTHSKKALSKKKAEAQKRAIYANTKGK